MPNAILTKARLGLAIAVVVVISLGGAALYENGQAKRLAAQNEEMARALRSTHGELDTLNTKIAALSEQQEQVRRAEEARTSAVRQLAARTQGPGQRARKDDPRWKQFQQRLDENGQAIESTRADLTNTRTELSGSIARTHDELVLLQKKGERNYYEFDLSRVKQFTAKGPVGIKLRKANTKHQFADLELMVDDVNLQKKHVNLYEPVVFYSADSGTPVELVINGISRDHIRGYVSAPKYNRSDLAAVANNNSSAAPPAETPQRRKLELPRN